MSGKSEDRIREALARCVQEGWTDESIDRDLYLNDALYHAIVFSMRNALAENNRKDAIVEGRG